MKLVLFVCFFVLALPAIGGPPLPVWQVTPEQQELWDRQDRAQRELQEQAAERRLQERQASEAEFRRKQEEREAQQRERLYHSGYEAIRSPEGARQFVEKYRTNDPDNLTPTALAKGYERGISDARRCIDFSQKTIDGEKEIGRTVGYVNKAALYEAGRNLLICRSDLKRYQAEAAKLGYVPAHASRRSSQH